MTHALLRSECPYDVDPLGEAKVTLELGHVGTDGPGCENRGALAVELAEDHIVPG